MSPDKTIPDLLPWDFAPELVLTPERILKYQAELIGKKSGGRLAGEVRHSESEKYSSLGFVIVAPSLDYALRLFSCNHEREMPYPCTISFRDFAGGLERTDSEKEFRKAIEKVFSSGYANSVFQSLLARAGEAAEELVKAVEKADELEPNGT